MGASSVKCAVILFPVILHLQTTTDTSSLTAPYYTPRTAHGRFLLLPNPVKAAVRPQENRSMQDRRGGYQWPLDSVLGQFLELLAGLDHRGPSVL